MEELIPTSELEAVNVMLNAIGESPVETLDSEELIEPVLALQILRSTSRGVQTKGWHWNTEQEYPLSPTVDNEIILPQNTLRVDTDGYHKIKDYVSRGGKLYDRKNHTFTITESCTATFIFLLAFEDLPEAARNYITIRAARIFTDRILGDESTHRFTKQDELEAKISLEEAEIDTADYNILSGSWSVARIIPKGINPWGW